MDERKQENNAIQYEGENLMVLGKCSQCMRHGLLNEECKLCKFHDHPCRFAKMMPITEFKHQEMGTFDEMIMVICRQCGQKNAMEFINDQPCWDCESPPDYEKYQMDQNDIDSIAEKCLPLCALPKHHKKCHQCYDASQVLHKKFSREVNEATTVSGVVRGYDTMIHNGWIVKLDDGPFSKSKLDYERMIQHHNKDCLCSLCKLCILLETI